MNTNLLHFQTPKLQLPNPTPKHSLIPNPTKLKLPNPNPIPARDRVIDFGKHKGKPLGALPSAYLRWVSKTLRARDFEHWAHLADQVLQDPVYQDRLEWELAQPLLTGDRPSAGRTGRSPVAELLEISDRLGWDNDDKAAWERINFELLGTSGSGRIPRRGTEKREEKGAEKRAEKGGGRRGERRERGRMRREDKGCLVLGDSDEMSKDEKVGEEKEKKVKVYNPFPGREGLLRDVLKGRKFL